METKSSETDFADLKQNVKQKFVEIQSALKMREKLLLRQLDVITTQLQQNAGCGNPTSPPAQEQNQQRKIPNDVKFLVEQETELLSLIRSFGRFQIENLNFALHDIYLKNEDYIEPTDDHETMYKCLPETSAHQINNNLEINNEDNVVDLDNDQPEAIVVDFSRNKCLVEQNAKLLNKSIINITLKEAKELIRKAKIKKENQVPLLNLEELDDELESSIADAVSSLEYREPLDKNPKKASIRKNSKSSQTILPHKLDEKVKSSSSSISCFGPKKNKNKNVHNHQTHQQHQQHQQSQTQRCKPKITINNCNGTINLRNISSLTINCTNEESINAEIPLQPDDDEIDIDEVDAEDLPESTGFLNNSTIGFKQNNECLVDSSTSNTEQSSTPTTSASTSNYSSQASSRSQSKKSTKKQNKNHQHSHQQIISANNQKTCGEARTLNYDNIILADVDENNDHYNAVTCDFYNRLLNEIKNNLKEKPKRRYEFTEHIPDSTTELTSAAEVDSTSYKTLKTCEDNSSNLQRQQLRSPIITSSTEISNNLSSSQQYQYQNQSQQSTTGKRLILKNFENLRIVLEANSGDEENFHPVQIEQWLAEIISETDLEPMQNTDILEHSKLNSSNNLTNDEEGGS